jgi:hypothetical protein
MNNNKIKFKKLLLFHSHHGPDSYSTFIITVIIIIFFIGNTNIQSQESVSFNTQKNIKSTIFFNRAQHVNKKKNKMLTTVDS